MNSIKTIIQQNKVYWIVLTIVLILSLFVILLGGLFSHNSVVKISHIGSKENADVVRQNFLIEFKRPMKNTDVDQYIQFEPNVSFRSQWNGRTLVIKPTENLTSLSDYTLKIDNQIKDVFGDNLEEDYEYTFKTKSQHLYYSMGDTIIKYDLINDTEKVVYKSDVPILTINAFEDILALRIGESSHAKALFLNIEEGTDQMIFDSSKHVSLLKVSPDGKYIWGLSQEIYVQGDLKLPLGNRTLTSFDIRSGETEVYDISDKIESLDSFSFSPDSKSILVEESYSNAFSLIDISSKDFVSVGKYIATRGFNEKGDKVLFVDVNWANLQDPSWIVLKDNDAETELNEEGLSAIDPLFITDTKIAFSSEYRLLENLRAMYDVVIFEEGKERERVHIDGYSLEYAQLSEDGEYLFLRGYTEEQLLQPFDFYEREDSIPAPVYYSLFVYHIESSEIVHIGDSIISSN
jgi:hypothetical protein